MARAHYVLRVRAGRELVVHDLLTADHVLRREGVECYTPFETRTQRLTRQLRAKRQRPRHYAAPVLSGWILVDLPTTAALGRLIQLIEAKPYLHGLLVLPGWARKPHAPLTIPPAHMARLEEDMGRSYDPRRDSRKNLQRIYAQAEPDLPELTEGEVVRILGTAWGGLDFVVMDVDGEMATLKGALFGAEREWPVHRSELEKVAGT